MNLLPYEQLFVSDTYKEGRNVFVYLYTKQDDTYTVHNSTDPIHSKYLQKVKASNTLKNTFLNFDHDDIFVYTCINDQKSDIVTCKENSVTAGAHTYKKLLYLNNHLNINLKLDFCLREFVSGIVLAYYNYGFLTKDRKQQSTISVIGVETTEFVKIYNAQNFVRFLGDTPANLMTPTFFVEYAKKYCDNLKIEIFDREMCKTKNMNLFLGVSQGSKEEPKLLKINYFGKQSCNIDVSLVGKGITFDTGGISLKPSVNMSAMKGDMMGAATVLAVIKLAADSKLQINIEAILPLSENMPGGSATKPGDVHIGMSGKSVEVDNTDAEGRLILVDALTLAQESKPKYIFDMATLTGAISVALGENYFGYFCNDDKLADLIYNCGLQTYDLAWRMPLSSLYLSSMKSNVANLKNAGGRKGGSCTAAIFLNEFIGEDVKWAHFDIAGVDWDHRNKVVYGSGMTGKGFACLYELICKLCEN